MQPKELLVVLAERVRQHRLARQWSREELAEKAGINFYTLKHFELTGQISLERLLKIFHVFDVLDEMGRLLKPRARVDVTDWQVSEKPSRQRGRRRAKPLERPDEVTA